jgi:hypothetical protein
VLDTYRAEPSCGFSFYDPDEDETDTNIDIYMSLYHPREMSQPADGHWAFAGPRRRLAEETEPVVPEFNATAAARDYAWNESDMFTRCDFIGSVVRGMKENNVTLRALEIVEYELCIQQRAYGEALSNSMGSVDLPKDLFYNWRTKYLLALDAFMGTYLYVNWAIRYDEANPVEINDVVASRLMYPKTFLSIMNLAAYEGSDGEGGEILLDEDGVYHANATVAETARAISKDAGTVMARIFNELQTHNLTMEWNNLLDGVGVLTQDILMHKTGVSSPPSMPASARRRLSVAEPGETHRVALRLRRLSEKTCQEPCINCEIVDVALHEVIDGFHAFVHYYDHEFDDIIEEFGAALGSPIEAIPLSITLPTKAPPPSPTPSPTPSCPDYSGNLSFSEKTHLFLNITDNCPIPMYEHGLVYYLLYPFEEGCDMNKVVYCQTSRQDYVTTGLMVSTAIALLFLFAWANVPYFNTIPILLLPLVLVFVYLVVVYEYQPLCLPYIPQCTVDDIAKVLDDTLESILCMCQYLPELVADGQCNGCEGIGVVTYNVELCKTLPHFDTLSIFWAPITALRVYLPLVLEIMFNLPGIDMIVDAIGLGGYHAGAVTELEIDCVNAHIVDVVTVLCLFASGGFLLFMWGETLYNSFVPLIRLQWMLTQQGLNASQLLLSSEFSISAFLVVLAIIVGIVAAVCAII